MSGATFHALNRILAVRQCLDKRMIHCVAHCATQPQAVNNKQRPLFVGWWTKSTTQCSTQFTPFIGSMTYVKYPIEGMKNKNNFYIDNTTGKSRLYLFG
jgi:hypothetical protein